MPALLEDSLASAALVRRGPDEPESLPDDPSTSSGVSSSPTRTTSPRGSDDRVFACQATELIRAGRARQLVVTGSFVRELTSGNVRPWRWISGMAVSCCTKLGSDSASRRVATALLHRDS